MKKQPLRWVGEQEKIDRRNEILDCIGFVALMIFLIFGVPWLYYIINGNMMEF